MYEEKAERQNYSAIIFPQTITCNNEKNNKNTFGCLSLFQSFCAKRHGFVFKNKFLRHPHTNYHITPLYTNTQKQKHRFLRNLKKRNLS